MVSRDSDGLCEQVLVWRCALPAQELGWQLAAASSGLRKQWGVGDVHCVGSAPDGYRGEGCGTVTRDFTAGQKTIPVAAVR